MRKRLCKLLMVISIFLFIGSLSSCKENNVNNGDKINEEANEKQKYVVELNMDNYKKYIDIEYQLRAKEHVYYRFYGVLSYAFYDEVVVTYYLSSSSNESTITLNAAGCSNFMYNHQPVVTNITGKVIYWI